MGVVVLQLGQGGNQMGCALFQCLASMSSSPPLEFFRSCRTASALVARSVLVDMEPKVCRCHRWIIEHNSFNYPVVAAVVKRARKISYGQRTPWTYSSKRQVTQDSGSGNNWARGFKSYGPKCREAVIDAIRLEVEECDMFGGFVTLQSMAGGTGSGLGAYLVEALSDEFPSSFILSHCIWPYESGEVIVQNYNVLLTLSHLQGFADGVIIVQNEQLSAICRSLLGIQRPSFDDMNDVAAQALASVLLPSHWRSIHPISQSGGDGGGESGRRCMIKDTTTISSKPRFWLLSDLLTVLCAHPGYRMLTLRFTPQVPAQSLDFTTFTWGAQLKHLRQMLLTGSHKELEMDWSICLPKVERGNSHANTRTSINRSIANLLILRGSGSECADVSGFADERMYPIWSVDPLSVATFPSPLGKYEMAAGLISNCQSSVIPASRALSRAYNMYASKAYLHQYLEQGLEAASFDAAFATVEDVIGRYLAL